MSLSVVVFQSWLVKKPLPFYAVSSFLHLCFHFGWKPCCFYLAYTLAAKSDGTIIVEGERSIKAAQKDLSATIVTSVSLSGAAVLGSVNVTEVWQRWTRSPSFLLLLSHKMDLLFALVAKWFVIITVFVTITFVLASFTVFHRNNLKQNWGCSMAVLIKLQSQWRKQNKEVIVAKTVITIIWLPDGSKNHCRTENLRSRWGHTVTECRPNLQ